jgi:hypothetical protein
MIKGVYREWDLRMRVFSSIQDISFSRRKSAIPSNPILGFLRDLRTDQVATEIFFSLKRIHLFLV